MSPEHSDKDASRSSLGTVECWRSQKNTVCVCVCVCVCVRGIVVSAYVHSFNERCVCVTSCFMLRAEAALPVDRLWLNSVDLHHQDVMWVCCVGVLFCSSESLNRVLTRTH